MKKKLLSLVLAGAMVASSSVSAFADDNREYTITDTGVDHQVTITGDVTDDGNNKVPGTISVTVPTAVSFTINKDGQITGGDIVVRNTSEDKVEVVAKKFTDTTPGSGIVLVKESNLSTNVANDGDDKVHASIKLVGNTNSLGLVSAVSDSSTGFVNSNGTEVQEGVNTTLGQAWNNNPLTLRLEGKTKEDISGDYAAPAKALKNTFNLVLKIQKAR